MRWLFGMLLCARLAAADPYEIWAQGRPAEALGPLLQAAQTTQRWDAWFDAGLAAEAAGQRGPALGCLLRAADLAPSRVEPRVAVRNLGGELPQSWTERAGPVAIPGQGWLGVAVLGLAGLLAGLGLVQRRGRLGLLSLAALLLLAAVPGQLALWLDQRHLWAATLRDTQALDSTGAPQRALPEGTVVEVERGRDLGQRSLVHLTDGSIAWVATADISVDGLGK